VQLWAITGKNNKMNRKRRASSNKEGETNAEDTVEVKRTKLPIARDAEMEMEVGGDELGTQRVESVNEPSQTNDDMEIEETPEPAVKIQVKFLTGRVLNFDVKLSDKTATVKDLIVDNMGIPLYQQRLVYNGKLLDDKRKLSDYKRTEMNAKRRELQLPNKIETLTLLKFMKLK
jgi:Ubiquitin family